MRGSMRKLIVLLLAGAAVSARAAGPSYYQEGLKLMKAERYQEAVVAFEKEAAENPGSAEVLMNLGWSYWKVNRIDEAWRCFDLLARLDPKNAGYLRMLAQTEIGRKEYPHALEHAQQSLKLLPGDKDSSIVMSSALIGLRRHREADQILKDLVERYPDSAAVQFHMADNLAAMGRLEEALAHFDIVMRLTPENRDYRRARANVLYALGNVGAAVAEWQALADLIPPDQKAIINLGWAAWKDRDVELAYKYGKRLLELDDKNPTYLKFMANLQVERGDHLDGLRLAQRALDILGKDKDASLIKAKALFNLRRDKEAMAVLTELLRDYPDNQQILFHMADFLDGMGKKGEALVFFNRLIKTYPDNLVYRYRRADIHYQMGEFDKAVAEWKKITEEHPSEVKALQLLADDAVSRNAWDEALLYMQDVAGRKPLDASAWQRMTLIYQKLKSYPQAIAAAEKAVKLNPSDQGSMFAKAETLELMGDWDGAEQMYHVILGRNPNSLRTLSALGRIAEQKGDYDRAIKLTRTVRKMSFSDSTSSPYLDILEARLLADSGRIEKGMRVLKKKATHKKMSIPVLLYHGVSTYERGDMMSVPRRAFEEQMRALKDKGYTPITVDDIAKYWKRKKALPEKPILITFDDARADAFNNGDPVLKDTGMKATMFVHLAAGFKRSRYYAGVDLLHKWNDTGRWEVQAHSDKAHELIEIDRAGHKGHFLANRRWLADKKRFETVEEFTQRLDADFKGARDKMQALFPKTQMHAYAFPFGDMGQTDFTNTPEAPTLNWNAVHKYFQFSFTQDSYGFNRVPTRVTDLYRWEVKREYSTNDVMRHLAVEEPWIKAKMLEANFWVRTNQPGRALSIYRMLRTKYGVEEAALYSGEALAFDMFGNGYEARKKWALAHEKDPGEDRYRQLAAFSRERDVPRVGGDAEYFSDNFTHNTKVGVRGSTPVKAARFEAFAGRAYYDNVTADGVTQEASANELGAGLKAFPLPRVEVRAQYTQRSFLEGVRRKSDNGRGQVTFPFFAPFRLGVKGVASDVETRQAIGQGLSYRGAGALAQWDVAMNTTLQLDAEVDRYSDGNRAQGGSALLTRKIGTLFVTGYSFRYASFDRHESFYYSPGRTATHTALATVGGGFGRKIERTNQDRGYGSVTYSAGYGTQDGQGRVIQGIKGGITWRIAGDLSAGFSAGYSQSPAYISRTLAAQLGLDF